MKLLFLKKQLAYYDENKGWGRTLLKEEPHIGQLRTFLKKFDKNDDDYDLTSKELLVLAEILLGKKTHNDSLSDQTLTAIANVLGGYKVLELLQAKNLLNESTVLFIDRNATSSSVEMTSLFKMRGLDIMSLFNATENIEATKQLYIFKLCAKAPENEDIVRLVELIKKAQESLIAINADTQTVSIAKLEILENIPSVLVTQANADKILALSNAAEFQKAIAKLPHTQEVFDTLCETEQLLEAAPLEEMLKKISALNIEPVAYLKSIISARIHYDAINQALDQFTSLSIGSKIKQLTFAAIFAHPQFTPLLIKALIALQDQNPIKKEELSLCFMYPQYAERIPGIIAPCRKLVSIKELALAVEQIQSCPQSFEDIALILSFLDEHKLLAKAQISAISGMGVHAKLTLELLNTLKDVGILDKNLLEVLLPLVNDIEIITQATRYLLDEQKLDRPNFESLLTEPHLAMSMAGDLVGKPFTTHPKTRQAVATLTQSKEALFFTPLPKSESSDSLPPSENGEVSGFDVSMLGGGMLSSATLL